MKHKGNFLYLYDMIRKATKKVKLNMEDYVNKSTGEIMPSEFINASSVNIVDNDYFIVESEDFFIVDNNAMRYVQQHLSVGDFEKLFRMMQWVYGAMNILSDEEGKPYTRLQVMEKLSYSRSRFASLIARLTKQGITYILTGYKDNRKVKYIMLNPTLARKRKRISKDCINVFEDLTNK